MPVKGNVRGVFVILEDSTVKNLIDNREFFENKSSLAKYWLSDENNCWDALLAG